MKKRVTAVALAATLLLGPAGFAQPAQAPAAGTAMPGHGGMTMPGGGTAAPMPPNHQEMMESMERMNRDMMAGPLTGNPDRDFVAMMMPHHRGAIDMARIYLRDGKDPAMRRMAQKIIADQEREIREMRGWMAKHPP